jgi:hypothetical protein
MKDKLIHRVIGAIVFLISAIQFIFTAQVSVPFWDPGELSAAAYLMQVPHPPGGPLFSLVGRIFYMLPITGDIGFRMNMVSSISSAVVVLFLYLVGVRVIENFKGKQTGTSIETIGTYLSAAVGALSLSFCDTFWFNGVESNYFAASTLLYSSIIWLMLVWNEKAEEPGSERYLLMIAYIAGLSGGLHLMSVLTVLIVGITIAFRKIVVDEKECMQSMIMFVGHAVLLFLIAAVMWSGEKSAQPPTQEIIDAFESKFKITMVIASIAVMIIFRKYVFHRNSYYIGVLLGGVSFAVVFPGIIRYMPKLLLLIAKDHLEGGLFVLLGLIGVLAAIVYWAKKEKRNVIALSGSAILLAILGFTTYAMIVIRANDNLPMNENNPSTFVRFISYLNREQYGDFPMFKRRWSSEPEKSAIYTNYSSDLDFFLKYQMNHMFQRYVAWNFIGRESDVQDADWTWKGLYGIPFFLGLFGLVYHFRKNWKMASVFLFAFILMGYLITYYQNQQQPQPRDREYFYCGAYFVFALWIGLGIRGLLDLVQKNIMQKSTVISASIVVLSLSAYFVPIRMFQENYFRNDRSKNWVPWDFAYNMLQTCEKDAVLFTQGDNDTFPLWYMQDVEGVRRDVRIVNLSLVNTPWYILQMKNTPAYPEAKPVPINIPDSEIEGIGPIRWEPKNVDLPVSKEAIRYYQEDKGIILDTSITKNHKITFLLKNTLQFGEVKALRVQDVIVYDIILANEWKRPIYFATTCSPDARIGLEEYLWFKGLAFKLEPFKASQVNYGTDPVVLEANLFHEPAEFSKTPQYGYKYRELTNPKVFFDENSKRIISNYRAAFQRLAAYYMNVEKSPQKSISVLDRMEMVMPNKNISLGWQYAWDMARFYYTLGRMDRVKEMATEIELTCLDMIEKGDVTMNSYYNPYSAFLDICETTKEYDRAINMLYKLEAKEPNIPGIRQKIQALEQKNKQLTVSPEKDK